GHLTGDRILRDVGALFLTRTRHEDIIARYGGDEFVLLVSNAAASQAETLAARLCEEVSSLQWLLGGETVQIGMTTGVSSSTLLQRPSISQLLSAGDRDLYKNKWVHAHPSLDPEMYEYADSRASKISEPLD